MKKGARGRVQILIACIAGTAFMMEQLDATIITTAAPSIAASFHTNPLRINLAITSYLLTLITCMPASGWLADRFGAGRVFCAALGVFTLASAFCGLAQDYPMLLAMRMLQGCGGGLMTPVGRSLLLRAFPRSQLVKAMTWFNVPVVVGPTIGPVIGGLISTYASWPWIFYVNVPFGMLGMLGAWRYMPDLKRTERPRFDLSGFLLAGACLVALQAAVQVLGLAHISWPLLASFLALSAAFAGAYVVQAQRCSNPILDVKLLAIRTFRVGVIAGGFSRIGINGVPYLLPLMLELPFRRSPTESGLLVAVTCLGIVLVRPIAAPLLRAIGFGRLLAWNCWLGALCIALMMGLSASTPDVLILLAILAFSLMRGMQFATLNTLSYADIPRERLSLSTSFGGVAQQITMGLGVAIGAALLQGFSANTALTTNDFRVTYAILSAITLLSGFGFLRLGRHDGAQAVPMKRIIAAA
jgi:EmrB/QacA subfamily drug resistance transporter